MVGVLRCTGAIWAVWRFTALDAVEVFVEGNVAQGAVLFCLCRVTGALSVSDMRFATDGVGGPVQPSSPRSTGHGEQL